MLLHKMSTFRGLEAEYEEEGICKGKGFVL
jgi:hypothetical protein